MGCDGGTIPRRDELVRVQKKPEQKDKDAERWFLWRNCALSQQQLQPPVVGCGLGRLYSKSSVLEALLDKPSKPPSISHIKSLKDIKDLNLAANPAYVSTEYTDSAVADGAAPYICPIIGLEMTGKFRFVFLWSCGCVFSERALKEIRQNVCHQCQNPFTDDDIIVLNGTQDDVEKLKEKMNARNANRKSSKKVKSGKIAETVTSEAACSSVAVKTEADSSGEDKPEVSSSVEAKPEADSSVEFKPETKEPKAGSSKTSNIKEEEMDSIPLGLPKKNSKYPPPRGHFGSSKRAHGNELIKDPEYKKTKKDYSVASDPKSSEVYKSLFTSHKSEKEQNRAHWVTYNPFYN